MRKYRSSRRSRPVLGEFPRQCEPAKSFRNVPGPVSRSKLQRLTQSLFQLRAIGSADSRPRTVFEDHFEFAVGDWFQAQDAFDVDDCRTMDADKTYGIEALG